MNNKKRQKEFLQFFETVRADLSRYCSAMTGNNFDAKDIINQTLLIAYEQFDDIEDKSSFKSYLFTIARRYYFKELKRQKRIKYQDDLTKYDQRVSNNGEVNHDVEILYMGLNKLPEEQKEALIMFEITGFKIDEIAEFQEASVSAVKSRLKRGREKLKEIIEEFDNPKKNHEEDEHSNSINAYNEKVSK